MKTRFCPSPTGSMHLGNVRTALFSALLAKSKGGGFLLRIEDTDIVRSEDKFIQAIFDDLCWLGLNWQEGPGKHEENGPYYQSKRKAIYDKYYLKLEESGLAYPCFCSEQQLAVMRKSQLSAGKPPRYTGICARLSKEEVANKMAAGLKSTLRFRVPKGKTIAFTDLVKGNHSFSSDDIGDFVIRRANGTASFMFCNALDDALMGVTHVIRGEDHVTNTPRQIMILDALGLRNPAYGHISLIVGFDGAPLSKRHGSSSIREIREAGILPIALLNYLSRLGCTYENNKLLLFNELADEFKVNCLSKSVVKFDKIQLIHWQKLAIHSLADKLLWHWMGEYVHNLVPKGLEELFISTVKPNIISPDDALYWAQIFFGNLDEFVKEDLQIIHIAGKQFYKGALESVNKFGSDYSKTREFLESTLDVKGKSLFLPLRMALTGKKHGPELAAIFELLGVDKILQRLTYAKELC